MITKVFQYIDKSLKDLEKVKENDDDQTWTERINSIVDAFNFTLKNLSLNKNFSSKIVDVVFASGETKNIAHLLGVRPKYRIILRQEGNGVLSDIPSAWSDKVAVIKNNGSVTVRATIMFLKE